MAVLKHHPQPARAPHLEHLGGFGAHTLPECHVLELRARLVPHALAEPKHVKRGVRAGREHEHHRGERVGHAVDLLVIQVGRLHVALGHAVDDVARDGHRHPVDAHAPQQQHLLEGVQRLREPAGERALLGRLQVVPRPPFRLVRLDVVRHRRELRRARTGRSARTSVCHGRAGRMRAPGRAFGLLAGFLAGFLNSLLNSLLDSLLDSLLNSLLDSRIAGRDGGFAVVGGFSAPSPPSPASPPSPEAPSSVSRTTSSQPWSGHHSCGLARADFSRLRLPFRKKSSCSKLSAPSPSSILMVIWNESISLCFSKSPRQVKLYTSYVSASTTLRRRCSRTLSFWTSPASSGTR